MLPCEWLGIPVVAHLRGSEFRDFYAASGPILRALIRYSLARVARVVVLGESLCSLFAGLVPAERISVIPNGTYDFTRGLDQPAKPTPCVQGLYLGNLLPRKGVFVAMTAVLEVLRRFPELEFVFAGEWQTEADCARGLALLAGRPEASRIRFPGVVTGAEKHRLLLASDFFLFPPIQPEGHPRVVLESMAAGLPIITTRQGAITETVVEGKTGFFVEPGDVRAIVGRIADLLNDPSRRAAMGLAARRRFEESYTADIAHARLAALFAEVLSLPSAGGQAIGGGLEESHGH
jgi:glycosyltransferase involved in cell wall biosynthesis